jgi:myosin light chain 6
MGDKKEVFNLFDDVGDGKIDATQIGTLARALGLKPTQAQVTKAAGAEYKRAGEKRLSLEEFLPIYEQLQKEKEVGTFADFMEGLRVFDKEECGKIMVAELRHALLALGERLTVEEADEIVSGIEDSDGNVNYESFIKKVMAGPFPEDAE